MALPILRGFIHVAPQSWKRAQGNGKVRFTSPEQRAYVEQIALGLRSAATKTAHAAGFRLPIQDPVAVMLRFHVEPPNRGSLIGAPAVHQNCGDTDNYVKAVLDALQHEKYGILANDRLVAGIVAVKIYAEAGHGGISWSLMTFDEFRRWMPWR